jgi:SAM-dependent methyltransferase
MFSGYDLEVDDADGGGTERLRRSLATGRTTPAAFRAALTSVRAEKRDAWIDHVFGLGELPDDGPELPRSCVPYLPSSVDTLLRMIELAEVRSDDVFVDVGSGLGRATALTHFLTGAGAIGIEIQPVLVRRARELALRLNAPRVAVIEGDAARLTGHVPIGSVYFLYCPFGGERLDRVLEDLASIAKSRRIRVCSVGLPLPPRSWLEPVACSDDLTVYRSVA